MHLRHYLILGLHIYNPAWFIRVVRKWRVLFSLMTWGAFWVISTAGSPFWGCRYHWTSDRFFLPLQGRCSEPRVGESWLPWWKWAFWGSGKSQNKTNSSPHLAEYVRSGFSVKQPENHNKQNNTETHWKMKLYSPGVYTLSRIKQVSSGKQLNSPGSSARGSVMTWREGVGGRREVQEGVDACIHMAEPRGCTAETHTIL